MIKKEDFGSYLINFFGISHLLDIHTNIADFWIYHSIPASYDLEYHPHYKGIKKIKEYTIDACEKMGWDYITDEENNIIHLWDIKLPDAISKMDISDEY